MANRSENRYRLPKRLGGADITHWVAGKPFFLASAIKYTWRGWEQEDDLRKALDCLEKAVLHEKPEFQLMHIRNGKGVTVIGCVATPEMCADLRTLQEAGHNFRYGSKAAALKSLQSHQGKFYPGVCTLSGISAMSALIKARLARIVGGK